MIESLLFGVRPAPFFTGEVYFPTLEEKQVDVSFLADTASTWTVLQPKDTWRAGILDVLEQISGSGRTRLSGIGGNVVCLLVDAIVVLRHPDGQPTRFKLKMAIAPPAHHNRGHPSLLGMDILSCGILTVNPKTGIASFDVPPNYTYRIPVPRQRR